MSLRYKVNVLELLNNAGYSQNRIRREKLIGQATLSQIRHGQIASWKTIDIICQLLNCQINDIIIVEKDKND